jgi:hypothetical protein
VLPAVLVIVGGLLLLLLAGVALLDAVLGPAPFADELLELPVLPVLPGLRVELVLPELVDHGDSGMSAADCSESLTPQPT